MIDFLLFGVYLNLLKDISTRKDSIGEQATLLLQKDVTTYNVEQIINFIKEQEKEERHGQH